jgi:tetratricopeptide (TPR) repeat protein
MSLDNRVTEALLKGSDEDIADLAEEALESGGSEAEIEIFKAAIAAGRMVAGLWNNFGNALASMGDHEGAQRAYSTAIAEGYPSEVNRGLSREALEDFTGARRDYIHALSRDPDDVVALIDLGTLDLYQGRLKEARDGLERAAKLDSRAGWQFGAALMELGDSEAAERMLVNAIAAGEARANYDLALLLAPKASRTEVERRFKLAIEAGASTARADYVIYLDEIGDEEAALSEALHGVELGDSWVYGPLAEIYAARGDISEAREYFTKAIEAGETNYEDSLTELEK